MIRRIFVICSLLLSLLVGEASEINIPRLSPLPVNVGDCRVSLNGEWAFTPSFGDGFPTEEIIRNWNTIEVPGEWVMQGFEVKKEGKAGYARRFTLPVSWEGQRIKLRCNAIYSECDIFVNGEKVGSHLGGFTAFELDVTECVKLGAENIIVVAVTSESLADSTSSASNYAVHPLGGITRDMYLFALPEVNFSMFHVSTSFDSTYTNAVLKAEVDITNESLSQTEDLVLDFSLKDMQGKIVPLPSSLRPVRNIDAGKTESTHVTIDVSMPTKWDSEHPYLYTLICQLKSKQRVLASTVRRVGFRQIEVRGNQVLVNGSPIKLRGVCRHEIMPLRGRSLCGDIWREDVELFRRGNVNYIRTSHYPPDEALLEACDELGMFVEVEAPFCWAHKTEVPDEKHYEVLVKQHIEMVNRDRSHPSVLMWSVGNESKKFAEYFKQSAEIIRKIDPTRPRIFSQWSPEADEGLLEVTNHHYPGPEGPKKYKDYKRPIVFDEFCHLNAYNRFELAADPGLRDMWGTLLDTMWGDMYRSPGVLGGAIWVGIDDTFFLPDGKAVGYGTWGTVDGWRRQKPEYWGMKKAYSPVKCTLIENVGIDGKVRLHVENRHLFTNLSECKLEWSVGNERGIVTADIAPRSEGVVEIQSLHSLRQYQPLELKVIGTRGFEIDRYSFCIYPEVKSSVQKKQTVHKVRCRNLPNIIEVGVGGKNFVINKNNGLLSLVHESDTVLNGVPSLMLLPLNKEGGGIQMTGKNQFFTPYNPVCKHWVAEVVEYSSSKDMVEVKVKGAYEEAVGELVYKFHSDGEVTVGYDFKLLVSVSPRQIGLVFNLPSSFTDLAWKRKGYWNVYPEEHISGLEGEARAFNEILPYLGLAGPSEKPTTAWAFDQTSNGSNIFRSTKENIYNVTLRGKSNKKVSVISDGNQQFRAWVDGAVVRFLVADYSNAGSDTYLVSHARKEYKPLRIGDKVKGIVRLVF